MTGTICVLLIVLACLNIVVGQGAEVLFEWDVVNYTWDDEHRREDFLAQGKFVPENCAIAGINVDIDGSIYLTVPRWKNGVPGTLNKLDHATNTLTPYPSWESQEEGACEGIQNVQSMTIDKHRRMWLVDVGRRNFFASDSSLITTEAAATWLIDLKTGDILDHYAFPTDVVPWDGSFLNDIAVDDERQIAYFSDAWGSGAIIILDIVNRQSRRYVGPSTGNDLGYTMIINGHNYGNSLFTTPIDGLALTDDGAALFYCAVQGTTLNRVSTEVLRNYLVDDASSQDVDAAVNSLGSKEPSDGIKYVNGQLFWGSLTESTYYSLPVTASSVPDMTKDVFRATPNIKTMHWIDTFDVDPRQYASGEKYLYFVSNRLDVFLTGAMNFNGADGANMRVLRLKVTTPEAREGSML